MILTGITLRSALPNLWVLIEPRVESDFSSAAWRDIFSQTVALLLKYTKTEGTFPVLEVFFFFCDFWWKRDSHAQAVTQSRKPKTGVAASPLFLLIL